MSQSIKSDRISESTIARMVGNMASIGFDGKDVLRAAQHGIHPDDPIVLGTVMLARAIGDAVTRTRPLRVSEVVAFVRGLRDSAFDAHHVQGQGACTYIADRIDEHFQDALRETEQQVQHRESGAAGPDATPERQARDLLLRLGVAGEWSSGDIVELANLFAENRRLQVARIGDSETAGRLMCEKEKLEQALAQRRRDEDRPIPDGALTIDVEVCLGCNQQTRLRGDCGCPAGTGRRYVPAISEEEYRQKAKAVRGALLGPGVPDPGHPPTVEMARRLRERCVDAERAAADLRKRLERDTAEMRTRYEGERSLRQRNDADLRDEINRLGALLQQRNDTLAELSDSKTALTAKVDEVKAHLGDALLQLEAQRGLRPSEQQLLATATARCLRQCAEEIRNSLQAPVVSDRELLENCVAWYEAQADNLTGQSIPRRPVLHGGGRGGGKAARIMPRCPTCDSPDPARHPAVQHEGEVQVCRHPFHGTGKDTTLRLKLDRFDGCPVCNAWEDGTDVGALLMAHGKTANEAAALLQASEPHMAICGALGFPHSHENIR